mmetsp:Transcript_109752/g.321290  ORF Transcript_109752/g.321290 Transcript_109752/m.321290 type:complete len:635 (-) Transcript_109752:109-2013(-)
MTRSGAAAPFLVWLAAGLLAAPAGGFKISEGQRGAVAPANASGALEKERPGGWEAPPGSASAATARDLLAREGLGEKARLVSRLHARHDVALDRTPLGADAGLRVPATLLRREMAGRRALDSIHSVATYLVLPGTVVLMFVLLIGSWMSLQRYTALIPDSAWQVFLAAIFGFFLRGLIHAGVVSPDTYAWASAAFLNLALLPVIIFQSGWALNHHNFMSQLEYIGIFAVLGTIISFFFVGFVGYWLGQRGLFVVAGLRENLAFAALISATDPVATLCTFTKLSLDTTQPLLYTLLFGESVLNDAVAVVLFHAVNSSWGQLSVAHCAGYMALLLFGSAAFGVALAGALVWLLRVVRLPGDTVPEALYIVASAWLTFAAAEACGLSGIIADLCAGCIFRLYGAKHLERSGLELADKLLHVTAQLMDSLVFILCGISTALIDSLSGLRFAVFGFLLCLFGRALSTSACAVVSNAIKTCMKEPESNHITVRHQCMMWHAGLRGGIALLLSMELDSSWCEHKATLINATFIIICSTLVIFGSTTEPVLRLLGLSKNMQECEGPDQKQSFIGEVQEDGPAKSKMKMIFLLHAGFKYLLVGDPKLGKEQRRRKRAFIESMKSSGSLEHSDSCGEDSPEAKG